MLSKIKSKILSFKIVKKISQLPITLKVTIWYSLFLSILILLFILASFLSLSSFSTSLSEREVRAVVHDTAIGLEPYNYYDEGVLLLIYDQSGQLLEGNFPNYMTFNADLEVDHARIVTIDNKKYLYYDEIIQKGDYTGKWIRGVLSVKSLQQKLSIALIILAFISPLLLLFISFVGYKIIKVGFKPVESISKTALEIGKNVDLTKRIDLEDGNDEIHHMANAFNQMLEDLEVASYREKQFSQDVSHELRTPIAVILAESQYGENHVESIEEAKHSFEVISRQTKKMSKLVHQLLEISSMDRVYDIDKQKINLSELIDRLFNDYKLLAQTNHIELEGNIESDLCIFANVNMIHRLMDNLFSNALKFTKSKIIISLSSNENEITLSVKDDGLGITKEHLEKIWERFYQIDPSRNKEKNSGFGLGLSIVKRITELNQGFVRVESEQGKGTVFVVMFQKH